MRGSKKDVATPANESADGIECDDSILEGVFGAGTNLTDLTVSQGSSAHGTPVCFDARKNKTVRSRKR
jgi:hypothetical protein